MPLAPLVCVGALTGAELALLNQLSSLRYHRADAHAAAWREDGRTAAEMGALPAGEARDAIEYRTNELAATAWSGCDVGQRARLRDALAELPY